MPPLASWRASLVSAVFPEESTAARRRAWWALPLGAVLVAAAVAVQLLRLPGGASVNTVWAEDGRIFLAEAKGYGGLGAVGHTYNGYVHLAPRLLAALISAFPLSAAAALLAILAATVVGLVAAFVYVAARDHIPSPRWRLALCASLVLMPVAAHESLDNIANLQWYLIAAAFWALLWRPRSPGWRVVQLALCLLAAASEPLALLLVPVAAARVVATRSLSEHTPTLGLIAGLAVQMAVGNAVPPSDGHPGPLMLGRLYVVRVLTGGVVGDRGDRALFARTGWVAPALLGIAVAAAIVAWAVWHRRRGGVWLLGAFAVTSVLFFAVPVYLRWLPGFVPSSTSVANLSTSSRYTVVPIFLLYGVAACALGGRWGAVRAVPVRLLGAATVAVVLAACVADFQSRDTLRIDATRWDRNLAAARIQCRAPSRPPSVEVAVAPQGWTALLPCRDVLDGSG
jgi:hypothetical protein